MEFGFTEEQDALSALARQCAEELAKEDAHLTTDGFELLTKTGISGLLVPESLGGEGGTLVEAGLVAEQFGRALTPAVVTGAFLITPAVLAMFEDEEMQRYVAARVLEGRPYSLVVDSELAWPPARSGLAWAWHPDADLLTPTESGALTVLDGVTASGITEDLTMRVAPVSGLPELLFASVDPRGWPLITAANVVLSCLLLGHMRAVLEQSAAYALKREQFGAKIGSFQEIKAILAEMLVDTEASHSIAYAAASIASQSDDPRAAARAGAVAKAWCGDAAIRVCESAIQVHGGIGFTWEVPIHRYLRAAHAARVSFMTPEAALDLVDMLDRDEALVR